MEKAYIHGSGLEVNEMDTTDRINVVLQQLPPMKGLPDGGQIVFESLDRKSTRLNSSHL